MLFASAGDFTFFLSQELSSEKRRHRKLVLRLHSVVATMSSSPPAAHFAVFTAPAASFSPPPPHRQRHLRHRDHIGSIFFAIATSASSTSPPPLRHHQLRHQTLAAAPLHLPASPSVINGRFNSAFSGFAIRKLECDIFWCLGTEGKRECDIYRVWARRENGSATFIVFGHGGKTGVRHLWYFS